MRVTSGMIGDNLINIVKRNAEKMLNIKAEDIIQKSYKTILNGSQLKLAEEVMENLADSKDDAVELPLRLTIDGKPRSIIMHVNALKDDMSPVSKEQLLKSAK